MKRFGTYLIAVGIIGLAALCVYVLGSELVFLNVHYGRVVEGISFCVFPATLVLAPFWIGIASGNWLVLAWLGLGGFAAYAVISLGLKLRKRADCAPTPATLG